MFYKSFSLEPYLNPVNTPRQTDNLQALSDQLRGYCSSYTGTCTRHHGNLVFPALHSGTTPSNITTTSPKYL